MAAATVSRPRGPWPMVAPAMAVLAAAMATFRPAMDTNTCARAGGGDYSERAARVAVKNGALLAPTRAKAAMASG
jgi:hypothetical protein